MIESGAWSAWLDGELDAASGARVQAHLAACAECRDAVEQWQATRRQLAAYAPPTAPQAQAFWTRLEPRLAPTPRPRRDPALYLAPASLALACLLVQGLGALWEWVVPLGGWRGLETASQGLAATSWLAAGFDALVAQWRAAVPPAWSGSLWGLAGSAAIWAVMAGLALFYGAWLILWLRRPEPLAEAR